MQVITAPTVTVVAHSTFDEHPVYKIPPDGTDAERLGAFAGKGCYDSYGETGRANIENQRAILEHRHGSVLEHSAASLFIEGVTRGLTLELNRHRVFSISQRSTRYTKEEDSAIVLEPYYADIWQRYKLADMLDLGLPASADHRPEVDDDYALLFEFLAGSRAAFQVYRSQVDRLIRLNPSNLTGFDLRKWARGKARNVLPHGLETRGVWTSNYRGWRWFIEVRSDKHAEPEIRRLADHVLRALRPLAPTYFEDFTVVETYDGIPVWRPTYSKV